MRNGSRVESGFQNNREVTARAISAISAALHAAFLKLGESIVDQVWPTLEEKIPAMHAAAADKKRYFYLDEADKIVRELDLDDLEDAVATTSAHLILTATDTAADALDRVGIDARELGRQADREAVDSANNRAAELVGKKWSGSGELIDNPDAKFAIDGTTRDATRDVIAEGFRNNSTVDEIASNIVSSTALSQERADLISRTEVFSLNNSVALQTIKQSGAAMLKEWNTTSDDPCESCLENESESAGGIPLNDDFASGDDAPTLHPRCSCELSFVTDDSDQESSEDDEE
jgi:uncharacterized protein with gpF-like domain